MRASCISSNLSADLCIKCNIFSTFIHSQLKSCLCIQDNHVCIRSMYSFYSLIHCISNDHIMPHGGDAWSWAKNLKSHDHGCELRDSELLVVKSTAPENERMSPLKRDYFYRTYTFQPLISKGHLSFPGSKHSIHVISSQVNHILLHVECSLVDEQKFCLLLHCPDR